MRGSKGEKATNHLALKSIELGEDGIFGLAASRDERLSGLDRQTKRCGPPQEPAHEVHPVGRTSEQLSEMNQTFSHRPLIGRRASAPAFVLQRGYDFMGAAMGFLEFHLDPCQLFRGTHSVV